MTKLSHDLPTPLREAHGGGGGRSAPSGERRPEGVIDLRGLKCPLPALMTRRRLEGMAPGTELTVWTTDPLAAVDIPHMCHGEGHALVECRAGDGHHVFIICRKP